MLNGYPLAISSWDHAEIEAIQEVIRSDRFTMGQQVETFEKAFAQYTGSRHCVMVNSGSSANLLAIDALFFRREDPLQRGDEVIVPAISWATTYAPLQQHGLRMRIVDVDLETLNYDLDVLRRAVCDRTRLIVAVNLLGNSNDFDAIFDILRAAPRALLLEDNCESMGATFKGRHAGTFGLLGTFSTFFSHHISTMEGGMIVTDDDELYELLLCLRSHGWTRHLPFNQRLVVKNSNPFDESYRFVLPGYNVRPVEMNGAIGTRQLLKLRAFVEMRRANAEYFKERFLDHPEVMIQKEIGDSSWFGFSLILRPESRLTRDKLLMRFAELEIESRPIVAGNFAKSESLRYYDYEVVGNVPHAERADAHGLFVGNHHVDIRPQIDLLASAFV